MHEGDNVCMLRDCDIFGFMADDFLHFTQSTSIFGPAKSTETFSLFSNFQCTKMKIEMFQNSQFLELTTDIFSIAINYEHVDI